MELSLGAAARQGGSAGQVMRVRCHAMVEVPSDRWGLAARNAPGPVAAGPLHVVSAEGPSMLVWQVLNAGMRGR